MTLTLKITKREGETWEDCARRYAKPYRLEHEVLTDFYAGVRAGDSPAEAAWAACYEWDLLDLAEAEPEQ